ncbi:MAG: hypothetical protein GXO63_03015 [Candidatus Micrarchaeota archaeon]|nr:hypothetical protein [Candidatus Micrarchaeota archaeon]
MVEFEVLETKEIRFGNNKFVEVARKKAKTPEGESEIISISKGFFTPSGEKRFKTGLGFEAKREVIDDIINALKEVSSGIEG